jgi:antitoxin component YwqK of YwqJK toxin-antitoxin module
MLRRTMSHHLAALAVSMLAMDSCSKQPLNAPLRDMEQTDGKWTLHGEIFTGVISDSYKDGKPRVLWEVKDGLLHGVIREWYANGQQSSETHFENGQRHGLNQYWDKDGVYMKEQRYERDKSISEKMWPNGQPQAQ